MTARTAICPAGAATSLRFARSIWRMQVCEICPLRALHLLWRWMQRRHSQESGTWRNRKRKPKHPPAQSNFFGFRESSSELLHAFDFFACALGQGGPFFIGPGGGLLCVGFDLSGCCVGTRKLQNACHLARHYPKHLQPFFWILRQHVFICSIGISDQNSAFATANLVA